MSDSTSIDKLPAANNINMEVRDNPVQNATMESQNNRQPNSNLPPPHTHTPPKEGNGPNIPIIPSEMEKRSMDIALNGIEQAGKMGLTELQSRDIPMNTNQISQDEQVKPDYLPNKDVKDYIDEKDTYDSMIEHNNRKKQNKDRLDMIYEEIQMPLLLSVLYFLFQLPFVQTKFSSYFPSLIKRDGALTLGGYLMKSVLFGSFIYLILKITKYFGEM